MFMIAIIVVNICSPPAYDVPVQLDNCSFATTPMWRGLELLSTNRSVLQRLVGNALTLIVKLNKKVVEGSKANDPSKLTGDELLDRVSTPRTVTRKSKLIDILYGKTTCFETHPGDCERAIRIPSFHPEGYEGLSSLIDYFIVHATAIENWDFQEGAHPLTPSEPDAVAVLSSILYDLHGGMRRFREILVEEQQADITKFKSLMILFFVLAVVTGLVGFLCCLVPTRGVLFNVAFVSFKLSELNPANDDTSRSGLGAAQWSETYSINVPRFDGGHQAMTILAAELIMEMDKTIKCASVGLAEELHDFKAKLKNMREEVIEEELKEHAEALRAGGASEHVIQTKIEHERRTIHVQTQTIKNPIIHALSDLIIGCFAVLSDEEHLLNHYRINESHREVHFNSHAVFLRKLQNLSLNIASTVSKRLKDRHANADYSAEFSRHTQMLIQLMAAYMTEHVGKIDREMVTRLEQRVPESDLVDVEINLTKKTIPRSLLRFLSSDNASIQDKDLFEKMKKVLQLT